MDAGTLELVELDEHTKTDSHRCQSILHDSYPTHSGAAEFLQIGPCVHSVGLRCASSVAALQQCEQQGRINYCDECGISAGPGSVTWIPIP